MWRWTTSGRHPDTLVVVTADHSHTSQIVAEDADAARACPTGYSTNLLTKDGQTLTPDLRHRRLRRRGPPPVAAPPSQHLGEHGAAARSTAAPLP